MTAAHPDRRTVLLGGVAVAALAWGVPRLALPVGAGIPDQIVFLDQLSEALIPGSAVQAPGAFLGERLADEWLNLSLPQVHLVRATLDRLGRGDYVASPPARRHALLETLDGQVFAGKQPDDLVLAWTTLKSALLTVYYTSEQGASKDLPYQLVPGRWEPDIPLARQPRPLSNDTLARWFT